MRLKRTSIFSATPNRGTARAREIEILAGESGSVVGLRGSGKPNLLGFLYHRPEVLGPYLPDNAPKLALVQIDLNNLPGSDLATFYRVILRARLRHFASPFHLTIMDPDAPEDS